MWKSSEREKEMSKVYVTQENPRVNIVSATKWGDLEPLTNPFDQIHINPIRLVVQIRRKLRRVTDDDWLLAMGDPAIIGVAFSIFTEMNRAALIYLNGIKWRKVIIR